MEQFAQKVRRINSDSSIYFCLLSEYNLKKLLTFVKQLEVHQKAAKEIRNSLKAVSVEAVWKLHGMRWKKE